MKKSELHWTCPHCKKSLDDAPVLWGCMWDWDSVECPHCGYSGYLDTTTGKEPDGSYYQIKREDE